MANEKCEFCVFGQVRKYSDPNRALYDSVKCPHCKGTGKLGPDAGKPGA